MTLKSVPDSCWVTDLGNNRSGYNDIVRTNISDRQKKGSRD